MKYMLIIAGADDSWGHLTEAEQGALYEKVRAWWNEHSGTGEILDGHELQPGSTATTIRRNQSGEVTVTDGPFVEGKEVVSGYSEIEVADLDEALRMVKTWPGCPIVEIRPVEETRPVEV